MQMPSSMAGRVALATVIVLVAIQAVPYGRDHHNPPVRKEPAWASARVRELAQRTCFDCHSNETKWPWYSHVAPASWLVTMHVNEGREHLNFSEWDRPQKDADEAGETVREGQMPLPTYPPAHPEARLTDQEREELAAGLEAMFGKPDEHGHDHEH